MERQHFRMIAQTLFGLEEVLRAELVRLGARDIERHNRAVSFSGDQGFLYKTNLCLRTAIRILVPIGSFDARNTEDLYLGIKRIKWDQFLSNADTFVIKCTLNTYWTDHSQFMAQKCKDAIVDRFREKTGRRPSVHLHDPMLRIHVHIINERVTVSLDSSGGSLHERGYRQETNAAPLNEVLAAGMVQLSGWDGKVPLVDPMCGSGTLLVEAALFAANIPPGIYRPAFGFQRWLDFDEELYDTIRTAMIARISEARPIIIGGDSNRVTVAKARATVAAAQLEDSITIRHSAFADLEPPDGQGMLIMNPPYGERMDEQGIGGESSPEAIQELYTMIGDTLKKRWTGWTAWVLTSNLEAAKHIRLTPKPKIQLFNGALDCRMLRYDLYAGSRRLTPLPPRED
ncbi:MAG: class I SAM-dependent RNA methyltransferase [Flavobacteriales bacterium]|nr:class I SAM-dependent RNA methyltransferase [Flavobacteriales bacterium]